MERFGDAGLIARRLPDRQALLDLDARRRIITLKRR
jgi:hypothetical protein